MGIEHQIDFNLRIIIPNQLAYRTNPEETNELQCHVDELIVKEYVRESLCHVLYMYYLYLKMMVLGGCLLIFVSSTTL